MEAKKRAYAKLAESKEETEKLKIREKYKIAMKEAKLVVTPTKNATLESLYTLLEGKDDDKKLYRLAKVRERRARDLTK